MGRREKPARKFKLIVPEVENSTIVVWAETLEGAQYVAASWLLDEDGNRQKPEDFLPYKEPPCP